MDSTPQHTTPPVLPEAVVVDSHLERLKVAISERNFCSGTRPLEARNFFLYYGKDQTARRLDIINATEEELFHLAGACDAATFGLGDEDILDESYRRAGKLDVDHFSSTFNLVNSRLVDTIRSELLEGENDRISIKAELYKLNVYSTGAFFKAHKDTPRSEEMFGSLVVVLPTRHEGGQLLLRHGGKEQVFDSAKAINEQTSPAIAYVAFFSDVEHEVALVTAGHRITLTYNLYFGPDVGSDDIFPDPRVTIVPSNETAFRAMLIELLSDNAFMADGGKLGFGLSHQYAFARDYNSAMTREERKLMSKRPNNHHALKRLVHRLKGSDAMIFRICQELSLNAYLCVVYRAKYTLMMVDHVIDLSNYEIENIEAALKKRGAVLLKRFPSPYDHLLRLRRAPEEIQEVKWVTELTPFNQMRSEYIAHGNQADLAYMYGDISLIVDVGNFGKRDTKSAAEAAKETDTQDSKPTNTEQ